MTPKDLKTQDLKEVAADWGIDYQTFLIKTQLIDVIKKRCSDAHISQRKLATLVPGLTQDRVSKIFSGQVGHMTIDKLVVIATALEIKVIVSAKAA